MIGLGGVMMVMMDGLLLLGGFNLLCYIFLIWVMVIVGGLGNNWGVVLGVVLVWFLWIKVEVWGLVLMYLIILLLFEGGLCS